MELNGISCLEIESITPNKQQIISSQSFGEKLLTVEQLARAIAAYADRASQKLRRQHSMATHIAIFIQTNPFSQNDQHYSQSASCHLPAATHDVRIITAKATQLLHSIYQPGFKYHKAGIILSALQPENTIGQLDLFQDSDRGGSAWLDRIFHFLSVSLAVNA